MSASESASKETIASLVMNFEENIKELHNKLKEGLSNRALMDEHTPRLYVLTQDIQNGIKFILMDIFALCKAEFTLGNTYEKRFCIKNIYASISEGYKLLYNFGKHRNNSLWKKLMKEIAETEDDGLISESREIDKRIETFGNTCIDKNLRDLTYHYNDVMIKVYQANTSIDNEDKVVRIVSNLWGLLEDIKLFTNTVAAFFMKTTGVHKKHTFSPVMLRVNPHHKIACNLINKDGKFESLIGSHFQETVSDLDSMAKHWLDTKTVENYIQTKVQAITNPPIIGKVQALINLQFLLRFMMLDMLTIIHAYIKSSSDIEYALILRRVYITKVATMEHLYGYNTKEKNRSIWKEIREMIPNDSDELKTDAEKISHDLDKIVSADDKTIRATFVHLHVDRKTNTDVGNTVSAIEKIQPEVQIGNIQLLIEINNRIMRLVINLTNKLRHDSHEASLRSKNYINNRMDAFIHKIKLGSFPDEQKKHIIGMLFDLGKVTDELFASSTNKGSDLRSALPRN